jgi:hypothetical protein
VRLRFKAGGLGGWLGRMVAQGPSGRDSKARPVVGGWLMGPSRLESRAESVVGRVGRQAEPATS